MRDFTKSGAFVAVVFVLVIALVPFGIEQIGETTGLFTFPVKKTIMGWFAGSASPRCSVVAANPVDWERYRQDLEAFTREAKERTVASVTLPPTNEVIEVVEVEEKPVRRIWPVPVVGCTAGDPSGDRKGYVFLSGVDHSFEEGALIAPSEELCGYEIVHVGERSVWFRAILEGDGENPMGSVKFPEFTRVDGESLIRGSRRYVARDAFPLESGGWLMVDSFLSPDGTVFKILDEKRQEVASILCVIIGEKGGR